MSIVAQKRNSRRFKAPISGRGTKGFSLNGGMRNQGWIGQTNLGRSNVGTVFRGAFPMGNGGCCGSYVINTQNSGRCCTNNPITSHQIESTVCKSRCKTNWVKDMSSFAFSSGEQIKWKKISAATKNLPWSVNKKSQGIKSCPTDCDAGSYWIGGSTISASPTREI